LQFARPANDISLGGWSSPAWSKTNEVVPDDDGSYTEKTGLGILEFGLSGVNDPGVGTDHIIRFRAKQQSGSKGPEKLNCQLYEGGVLIAETGLQTLTRGSHVSFEYALSEIEANSIGNYNDLRLKFVPDQGDTEVMRLTWAEVQVPDATGEEHSGSSSVSGNGSLAGTAKKGGKGSALKSAGGTLLAIGLAGMLVIASIVGGGSQLAVGKKSASAGMSISGGGSQLAVGKKDVSASASVSGGGSVIATGQAGEIEEHSGIAIVSENGVIVGTGTKQARGDSVVAGGGSIVATGQSVEAEEHSGIAAVSGDGVLIGLGAKSAVGMASISGNGNLVISREHVPRLFLVDPRERIMEAMPRERIKEVVPRKRKI